ncbi:MAG: glycosyltransferase family 2 protein [Saprospiraceae bacterium]|nr:glycosyltransferase family 2 protein [Saprospiraceae bacterium]
MISIIMPVKNALPYLKYCLDSIIDQVELEWELLAVDDHSDDASYQVLQDYASREPRILSFKNPGSGIIDALKEGYSHAKGQFITRMDADDVMPKIKLETLKNLLLKHGNGNVATGKVRYINEDGIGEGYKKYELWLNNLCDTNSHFSEIYKECVIPSPCWMMFRNDFEDIGGFNSETYPEDYDLCFRMYTNQLSVIPSFEVLHIWRDYPNRTSRTDEHYSDNRFIELKLSYFLKEELLKYETLFLWGAGKKGKRIAQLLIQKDVAFAWYTNNRNKIGKDIYSKSIQDSAHLNSEYSSVGVIVAVANEEEQQIILEKLFTMKGKFKPIFFC